MIFGDRLIMKLYRRLEPGTNPDLEIGRFLTERGFPNTPAVAGALEYRRPGGEGATLASLQQYVVNEGDFWEFTLDELGSFLERAAAASSAPEAGPVSAAALLQRAAAPPSEAARLSIGSYLDRVGLLGTRTGELHRVLASEPNDPAFAPEPFSALYQRSLYQSIRSTVGLSLRLLAQLRSSLPEGSAADSELALGLEPRIEERLGALLGRRLGGMRIRHHGDFHAGQVLFTGRDFVIIDFEGEPGRPLGERRLKRTALTDVAGMIRSFHYAANVSLRRSLEAGAIRPEDAAGLDHWANFWYGEVSAAFLAGYRAAVDGAEFLPRDPAEWAILLDALLFQKAFYELDYELNNRPDWVSIPLRGIVDLVET